MNFFSPTQVIDKIGAADMERLDQAFMNDGLIQPVSYAFAKSLTLEERQYYCLERAIYGLITHELVNYLQKHIEGKNAIEIGSGNGTLGRALGIPLTDNRMQQDLPEIKMHYETLGQTPINYPSDIEKLDALSAVAIYQPEVVIGSWITHLWKPENPKIGGNMYGVDEIEMMKMGVKKYIMLGNLKTHKLKPILKWKGCKVTILKLPFLISRSRHFRQERLFIFRRK